MSAGISGVLRGQYSADMVFYDAGCLNVEVNRRNYRKISSSMESMGFTDYLKDINVLSVPATRKNARMLKDMGLYFDESAKIFLEPKALKIEGLYPFQNEGVQRMLSMKTNILLADAMGCLDGDTVITINHCKKSQKMTMSKFYKIFHRIGMSEARINMYKDEPYYIRSFNEQYFRLGEVVDVIDSGYKECVKVTTETGKTLILTPDHEIYTENGTVKAIDSLGVMVLCNGTTKCPKCGSDKDIITYPRSKFRGYCKKCMYAMRDNPKYKDDEIHRVMSKDGYIILQGKPMQGYKGRKWTSGIPEHTYVMEQHLGRFLKPGEVVHHIDGNKLNNAISNLMLLDDESAHAKLHGYEKYKNFGFVNPKYEKVVSVEPVGVRHVYDIKVLNHNNFVANHILIHNCGKTVQVAAYMRLKADALPALIVCPASLKLNWERELKKWCGIDSYILWGKQPAPIDAELLKKYKAIIINYDILGTEDREEKEKELARRQRMKDAGMPVRKKNVTVHGWCDILGSLPFSTIVCDEVQFIAEGETIRARGVSQICKALPKAKKIFVSGTPYETKTAQFYTALSLLDPEHFNNRYKFLMRYCNPKKTYFGWKFEGASNTEELREKIGGIMIRRLKEDVLRELPPKMRSVIPLYVSDRERASYEAIDKEFEEDIRTGKKPKAAQLGHIAHLKKGAYDAKENALIEWVNDYLSSNDKLVLFVWHKDSFERMLKEFKKYRAVGINGSTPASERQAIVDSFQTDPKVRLFVGQIQACGAGITLTASNAVAFAEFGRSWVQHEQAEDRVSRIGQKADSILAYYLILPDSIEEDIMATLERRNRDMKLVLDGVEQDTLFETEMNEDVLRSYKQRKNIDK